MNDPPPTDDRDVPREGKPVSPSDNVTPYDLSAQDRIIRGRMPALEIIHDRFVRMFRLTLSSALRLVVDISIESTELVKFGEFLHALPVPSSLNLFRMRPLRGNAIMVLETDLVFNLLNLFFGGTGTLKVKAEGRDFSAIEQRMVKRVVVSALEDLQYSWQPIFPLQISYTRSEVNPQFVAIVPHSEVVVIAKFAVEMGGDPMFIKLIVPYSMLEPIEKLLTSGIQSDQNMRDLLWYGRFAENIAASQARLVAQVEGQSISVRDFLYLEKGDLLKSARKGGRPVNILFNGTPKYSGTPNGGGGNRAVRIDHVIPVPGYEELQRLKNEALELAQQQQQENLANSFQPPGEPAAGSSADTEPAELSPMSAFTKWEPRAIAAAIMHEHPQTIALILANLQDTDRTARVLEEIPEQLHADVVYRMTTMQSVQPGVVAEINAIMKREYEASGPPALEETTGPRATAELLAAVGQSTRKHILATIEKAYPEVAKEIRSEMKGAKPSGDEPTEKES